MAIDFPFTLIAGPCVIESRELVLEVAAELKAISERLAIRVIFKASFDKANRSAGDSFRGPGLNRGLEILAEVMCCRYQLFFAAKPAFCRQQRRRF